MTTKLEQAARQALEALEVSTDWDICAKGKQLQSMKAITALREALAEQAEQKPVAFGCRFQDGSIHDCICPEEHDRCEGDYNIPLYAAPVRTKDLTDDEIEALFPKPWIELMTIKEFVRAVIAADRENNK